MPVHADAAGRGRRAHRCGIPRVVDLAADLIVEVDAEIEPEERNARAEAAVKVGDRIAAEVIATFRIGCGGRSFTRRLPVLVRYILIPHGTSVLRDAGVFLHIEGIQRQPLAVEEATAGVAVITFHLFGAAFGRQ